MPAQPKSSPSRRRFKPPTQKRSASRPRDSKCADPQANGEAVKVSTPDQVAAEIVRGLYDGRFVPGQKLTELDLTRSLGVGRGAIREAFRRLAAEGIISINLHRGAYIRSLTRGEVGDILQIVEALNTLSARLAAERVSRPEDKKALRDTLARFAKSLDAEAPFERARIRNSFYRQIAQLSGNAELVRLIPSVQTHLIRVQFRAAYGAAAERRHVKDYQAVIDAILARDSAKAEQAMRQHIRRTAKAIMSLPDDVFR